MGKGEGRWTEKGVEVRWIAGERSEKWIATKIGPEPNEARRRREVDGKGVRGDLKWQLGEGKCRSRSERKGYDGVGFCNNAK